MAGLASAVKALLALGYGVAMAGISAVAILALFGFAVPVLDLFNHLQLLLFAGCLLALVTAPVFLRPGRALAFAFALSATGLTASGVAFMPEALSALTLRHEAPDPAARSYRLMTFNVFGRNETPMAIVETVLDENPDIVALQEYSLEVRRRIHSTLLATYPHFQYCQGGVRAFVALYSKIPFEPLLDSSCPGSLINPDRTARIVASFLPEESAPFTVVTTHHDWPAPIWRQRDQFASLSEVVVNLPMPFVLVADFNSTPWSYALRDFVATNALTRHTRNLPTFPMLWFYGRDWRPTLPILPLDHVMTRGDIAVHAIATGDPSGSDHLPVIVDFSVPETP